MPLMPDPIRKYYERERPIELRPVVYTRYMSREKREPQFRVWMRANGPLPDDPAIHEAVLAYASDMTLLDTALVAHGRTIFEPDMMPASLDHALWLHRPFPRGSVAAVCAGQPITHGARGLCRGLIFARMAPSSPRWLRKGCCGRFERPGIRRATPDRRICN